MARLEGKVAFITGGARGQGREIARRFAGEGADIIIGDACQTGTAPYDLPTEEDLQETADMVTAAGQRCVADVVDVRDQEAIDGLVARGVEEFGRLDIACANAGVITFAPLWETTEPDWDLNLSVNLGGAWRTAKSVAPYMIRQESGSIIFTSSTNGIVGGPDYSAYTAAKTGVLGLMRTLAQEVARYGVRSNAILPGAADTVMMDNAYVREYVAGSADATIEELREACRPFSALKGVSLIPPSAMADAALWLASDEASHITGIEIPVDAGHLILPHHNWDPVA